MESLSEKYDKYCDKYNGNPKHDFSHFARVVSMVSFHREFIRPKIQFWEEVEVKSKFEGLKSYKVWTKVTKFLSCGLAGIKIKK